MEKQEWDYNISKSWTVSLNMRFPKSESWKCHSSFGLVWLSIGSREENRSPAMHFGFRFDWLLCHMVSSNSSRESFLYKGCFLGGSCARLFNTPSSPPAWSGSEQVIDGCLSVGHVMASQWAPTTPQPDPPNGAAAYKMGNLICIIRTIRTSSV